MCGISWCGLKGIVLFPSSYQHSAWVSTWHPQTVRTPSVVSSSMSGCLWTGRTGATCKSEAKQELMSRAVLTAWEHTWLGAPLHDLSEHLMIVAEPETCAQGRSELFHRPEVHACHAPIDLSAGFWLALAPPFMKWRPHACQVTPHHNSTNACASAGSAF